MHLNISSAHRMQCEILNSKHHNSKSFQLNGWFWLSAKRDSTAFEYKTKLPKWDCSKCNKLKLRLLLRRIPPWTGDKILQDEIADHLHLISAFIRTVPFFKVPMIQTPAMESLPIREHPILPCVHLIMIFFEIPMIHVSHVSTMESMPNGNKPNAN